MEKSTLEALQGSIRKWDGIAKGEKQDLGTINCPLCAMFYEPDKGDPEYDDDGSPRHCVSCPVAQFTEEPDCDGTPYYEFRLDSSAGWARSGLAIKSARAEHQFLINLLPKGVAPETYREKKSDSSSPMPNADGDPVQAGLPGGGSR